MIYCLNNNNILFYKISLFQVETDMRSKHNFQYYNITIIIIITLLLV